MAMIASASAVGIFCLAAVIGAQLLLARRDRKSLARLKLRPNCLLTRYPIIFVSGRRSPFYFVSYWNRVPEFLLEHGYEVLVVDLPWRGNERRLAELRSFLRRVSRPCHLIGESSVTEELREARSWNDIDTLASVTVVETEESKSGGPVRAQDLRPQNDGIQRLRIKPSSLTFSATRVVRRFLIAAHNLFVLSPSPVRAAEVALPESDDSWNAEMPFLDFAISLAERDAR